MNPKILEALNRKRDELVRIYREKHMRDDDLMTFADCRKAYGEGLTEMQLLLTPAIDALEFYAIAGPMELAQDCGFEMDSIDGLTVMVPGKRAREALAWKQVEK